MKSIAMRINSVQTIGSVSCPKLYPFTFNACRQTRNAEPNGPRTDKKELAIGLLGNVWNAITASRTKPCNECLLDISDATERCPHCHALQNNEAARLRRREAGWY